jgi:pimeloyl-ACP methyl ester carboxylesterase
MAAGTARMTHLVALVVGGLVLLYFGLLAMLWKFQEQIVFQPPANAVPSSESAHQVHYRAPDGVELFAYVVGECTTGTTVLLAFHGNADLSRWLVPWAREAARATDACVVLPEFRGYDGLTGPPTYAASALDARAALEFVRTTMGARPSDIVYFGHSLGTAIATELAAFEAPRSLVLQSPFSSARAMGARMIVPGVAAFWRFISRVHFDTADRVRRLSSPVWVAHGDRDLIIPVRMGREVFDSAAQKGELLIVNGAGHNDVPDVGGARYWNWLRQAVEARTASDVTRGAPAERRLAP